MTQENVFSLVIFSFLGYMAKNLDKDISSVAATGPGLVFTVYPQAISTLLYSPVWSVMFFLMLITLGLDSTVSPFQNTFHPLFSIHLNFQEKSSAPS